MVHGVGVRRRSWRSPRPWSGRPAPAPGRAPDRALPERVTFPSADGVTTLVGYRVSAAADRGAAHAGGGDDARPRRRLLVVRTGSTTPRRCRSATRRGARPGPQQATSRCWSTASARAAFRRVSAPQLRQPAAELNEVTVRPLDAAGALAWLRTRADVDRRSHRPAGLVERRQRRARHHGGRSRPACRADRAFAPRSRSIRPAASRAVRRRARSRSRRCAC